MTNKSFRFYNAHPWHLQVDDCVKRAIALTVGMDYRRVARELNAHKKVTGVKVFYDSPNPRSYVETVLGFPRVALPKREGGERNSVGEFAKAHPNGRYILSLRGHWTACIDGTVYDTWDCTSEEVLSYYAITRFERTRTERKYCFTAHGSGESCFVTVYDGNGCFATKRLSKKEGKAYVEELYRRGFFNFDEMGEFI